MLQFSQLCMVEEADRSRTCYFMLQPLLWEVTCCSYAWKRQVKQVQHKSGGMARKNCQAVQGVSRSQCNKCSYLRYLFLLVKVCSSHSIIFEAKEAISGKANNVYRMLGVSAGIHSGLLWTSNSSKFDTLRVMFSMDMKEAAYGNARNCPWLPENLLMHN